MYFLDLELSELSSVFKLDEEIPRFFDLKILSWKLKGHNQSGQKNQNVFFLMYSLCLMELIATDGIGLDE